MTSSKPETLSSSLFRSGRITLTLIIFMVLLAIGSSPVRAQSASPETHTPKPVAQTKKSRPAVAGQASKPAGAKAKPRVRGTAKAAKPASEPSAQSSDVDEKAPVTPPVRTSETVDFETEDEQKMEPGYELIQGAPRRARHRSLVPASPSPEDSVVNRP